VGKINEQLKISAPAWITYSALTFPDIIRTGISHFELNSYCLQTLLSVLIIRPIEEFLKAKFAFLSSDVQSNFDSFNATKSFLLLQYTKQIRGLLKCI
jgi:hypothetical protein